MMLRAMTSPMALQALGTFTSSAVLASRICYQLPVMNNQLVEHVSGSSKLSIRSIVWLTEKSDVTFERYELIQLTNVFFWTRSCSSALIQKKNI